MRTATSLPSSAAPPIDGARGRATSPGTKKTGSHLARRAAPGPTAERTLSASPEGARASRPRRTASRPPHPAREEGKATDRAAKIRFSKTSRATKSTVEAAALAAPFE